MIAAWLATLALASPQQVAELEWARVPPVMDTLSLTLDLASFMKFRSIYK